MTDLRSAARALGGEVSGRQVLCPGPGHSPRDRSLAVRFESAAPDGFLIFSHTNDDVRSCRDHVRRRLGLPEWQPGDERNRTIPPSRTPEWDLASVDHDAGPRPRTEDDFRRIEMATRIWNEARDAGGTLAEVYLREHRKLDLSFELAGPVLRFHPACPWRDEDTGKIIKAPALIAAFRSVDDDELTAVHRIRLNPDGSKYGRRMLGVVHRAAVKLAPATDRLAIGEGVETVLAAQQLGLSPAWALGSVGAISFFPVIDGVNTLILLGEPGAASKRALEICGKRWRKAGRTVRVRMPTVGADLNDEWIAHNDR
jgi:putative DNA primase/helicase